MFQPISENRILETSFVDRPNQFLVRCRTSDGRLIRAFLPNPGRMWELLFPEAPLYLSDDRGQATTPGRTTLYTVIGTKRDGELLFLHTGLTNAVARHLIETNKIPSLQGAEITASEVSVGRSRFDFLLDRGGKELYLEVKSCTLYGNRIAMFPDAVTSRGRRHLLELAELSLGGLKPVVLFVVHTPQVDWFMPDYHSDIAFSRTLMEVRDTVDILAVSVTWQSNFSLAPKVRELTIPWTFLDSEIDDRGGYLLLLRLSRRRLIKIGQLGSLLFEPGHYIYVGSAMANLSARLARHTRRRKRMHWHVDHLRQNADAVVAVPIRCARRIECELAEALKVLVGAGTPAFGCSDCACESHLFFSPTDPLKRRDFHDVLQQFRMPRPPAGKDTP